MSPQKKQDSDAVFVATGTFACELDGERLTIHKGETRVRAGHRLLEVYGDSFERVENDVHFDVEQATAAPGEKRGQASSIAGLPVD